MLVIDDNVDAAESLRAALTLRGNDVAIAFDRPSGLFVREGRATCGCSCRCWFAYFRLYEPTAAYFRSFLAVASV
jgi:hypothetical protein